jgi:hypothetical protein
MLISLTKLRWLLLNFDYLGAGAVFITSLLGISSFVPAGLAGICITVRFSKFILVHYLKLF